MTYLTESIKMLLACLDELPREQVLIGLIEAAQSVGERQAVNLAAFEAELKVLRRRRANAKTSAESAIAKAALKQKIFQGGYQPIDRGGLPYLPPPRKP